MFDRYKQSILEDNPEQTEVTEDVFHAIENAFNDLQTRKAELRDEMNMSDLEEDIRMCEDILTQEQAKGDQADQAMLREYSRDLRMKKEDFEAAKQAEKDIMDEYS